MLMPLPIINSHSSPPPNILSFPSDTNPVAPWTLSRVSFPAPGRRQRNSSTSPRILVTPNLCSKNEHGEVEITHAGDVKEFSSHSNERKSGGKSTKAFSSNEIMQSLKRYGVAGVLSYGLLNTVYYLTTFLLVWFYFAPAPGNLGYAAAVKRFLKLLTMVWAGSQVTKIARAGGALALAPLVDRGLSWFTVKYKFESQGKAFAAIAGLCVGLALLLFFALTLLWA